MGINIIEALPQAFERDRVRHGQGAVENANDNVGRTSFGQFDDKIPAAVELAAQPLQPAPRSVGGRGLAVPHRGRHKAWDARCRQYCRPPVQTGVSPAPGWAMCTQPGDAEGVELLMVAVIVGETERWRC
jgi:hypothetical protein